MDVMTAAFREYAGVELKKKQVKKPSVRKKLQKSVERKAKHRQRVEAETKNQRSGTMMREKLQKIQVKRLVILNLHISLSSM